MIALCSQTSCLAVLMVLLQQHHRHHGSVIRAEAIMALPALRDTDGDGTDDDDDVDSAMANAVSSAVTRARARVSCGGGCRTECSGYDRRLRTCAIDQARYSVPGRC